MRAVFKLCSFINKSSSNRSIVTLKKRELYTLFNNNSNNKYINNNNKYNNNHQNIKDVKLNQKMNYSQALGSLTKDQAHDFVFRLNEEERSTLYSTLEQFQMKEDKRKLECKSFLIASAWASFHFIYLNITFFHLPTLTLFTGVTSWQISLIRLLLQNFIIFFIYLCLLSTWIMHEEILCVECKFVCWLTSWKPEKFKAFSFSKLFKLFLNSIRSFFFLLSNL